MRIHKTNLEDSPMERVPMQDLVRFGVAVMTKRGVPEANARALAEVIVTAEAFRRTTHGIVQLKALDGMLGDTLDPAAEPQVVRQTAASALIDGERCIGNLAMIKARELAVAMAREQGVGFVAVRNTSWVGALGIHLIPIARQGLLAKAWAQTNTCKDCAPVGGIDARFSTNPIALAFPTDGAPVLADFSTATMSLSAAYALIQKGENAATPRFLDKNGNPTSDPLVMKDEGTMFFAGGDVDGHKAYGLSLFNEALTVLAGGSANNPEEPTHQSIALMVLDPDLFAGADYYRTEMERYIGYLRTSRPRPGFDSVRLPGERGFAALEDAEANGVPLDESKLQMLREIAEKNEIEPVA